MRIAKLEPEVNLLLQTQLRREARAHSLATLITQLCLAAATVAVLAVTVSAVHAHHLDRVMVAVLPLAALATFEPIPGVALAAAAPEVGAILERVGPELLAEATAKRQARMVDVDTLEEAIVAANDGFARIRRGALGDDGEDRLAEHALTIRCLQRPDGSLAEPDDAEADLTAVVGRSY